MMTASLDKRWKDWPGRAMTAAHGVHRRALPVAALRLALLVVAVPAGAADTPAAIAQARGYLAELERQPAAGEFARIAKAVGPVIDEVRQSDVDTAQLETLRGLLDRMREQTEKRLAGLERETNEDEAALERLYRSQAWDDISFSLAAFPYWRAWMDLEIARRIDDEGLRTQALLPALKGFRSASMQLFRPGLVYGGWLGIGYVEMAQGHNQRARQIFQTLDEALAREEDSPIRAAVQLELRLLESRTGQVKASPVGRKLDDNEAKILRIEAFALLQESRRTGGRPLLAAERLKALVENGYVDQSLLADMMTYAQELSGVDIGAYTDLAGAEFALQYDHYYNAMQKYESFFKRVDPPARLDLDYYRFRWALAAYKAQIYQPAVDVLERLLRQKNLAAETNKAATKLLYAVYAARESSGGSPANRRALREAAQRFVKQSPNDKDADAARLMIAQTAANASTALDALGDIRSANRLKGDVERTAFHIIARDFSKTIARGRTDAAIGTAKQGIRAFQKLPKADKADPFNFAILLQMRALVDENPEDVLKALDSIEKKGSNNLDIRRALAWSRLQLYDRMGDPGRVAEHIRKLAAGGIPSWQMEFIYPWIAAREDRTERLELARIAHPAAHDQPDMDRRFRNLIIGDLLELGEHEQAYDEARAYTKDHPGSGDAWQLLARAAEATDKPFEADRAWRVITDKAVPTMTVWWDGMLNRVRIRTHSTRPEEACPLLDEIARSAEHMPDGHRETYASVRDAARCPQTTAAAP
ncbi:MAG: hypothetical protein RLW62_22985 [Gammaproteobacteria bacterium]